MPKRRLWTRDVWLPERKVAPRRITKPQANGEQPTGEWHYLGRCGEGLPPQWRAMKLTWGVREEADSPLWRTSGQKEPSWNHSNWSWGTDSCSRSPGPQTRFCPLLIWIFFYFNQTVFAQFGWIYRIIWWRHFPKSLPMIWIEAALLRRMICWTQGYAMTQLSPGEPSWWTHRES